MGKSRYWVVFLEVVVLVSKRIPIEFNHWSFKRSQNAQKEIFFLTQYGLFPLTFSMILGPNLDDPIIIFKEESYIRKMKL